MELPWGSYFKSHSVPEIRQDFDPVSSLFPDQKSEQRNVQSLSQADRVNPLIDPFITPGLD